MSLLHAMTITGGYKSKLVEHEHVQINKILLCHLQKALVTEKQTGQHMDGLVPIIFKTRQVLEKYGRAAKYSEEMG